MEAVRSEENDPGPAKKRKAYGCARSCGLRSAYLMVELPGAECFESTGESGNGGNAESAGSAGNAENAGIAGIAVNADNATFRKQERREPNKCGSGKTQAIRAGKY